MKTFPKITLALLTIVTLTVSTAFAGEYNWREKVTYGNDPTKRSTSSSSRSYARPYATWRQAYSYEPAQVESRRAYSYEPAAPAFKVGDTIVVTPAIVPMKIGDRVVATVPQGQRITVSSVEGPWIGTNIEQNGKNVGGWILANDLATGTGSPSPCR
jgi:hypothetical protein